MAEGTSISTTPVDEALDASPPAYGAVQLSDVSNLAGRPLAQMLWSKDRSTLQNGANVDGASTQEHDEEDDDDDDDDDDDEEEDEPERIYPARDGIRFRGTDDDDFVAVDHSDINDYPGWCVRSLGGQRSERDRLHPYVQLLSVSDIDACEKVESAFPENERCPRENIIYRLSKCPELSLGIFSIPPATDDEPNPKPMVIAHILSTRTSSPVITNATMAVPKDWRNKQATSTVSGDEEPLGHQDQGSTIAIHSLAVLPEHQDKGLGKMLMKSYIQRIQDAKIADRIVLLAHDHLLPFYAELGFTNVGRSKCTFGGGGWNDLVIELNQAN